MSQYVRRRWGEIIAGSAILFAPCLCFLATPIGAQTATPPPWTVDSIRSTRLGTTRRLRIALPSGYEQRINASHKYPVLLILGDADDDALAATVYTARVLTRGFSLGLPPLIIVGVSTSG